jgi:hypothetical protein
MCVCVEREIEMKRTSQEHFAALGGPHASALHNPHVSGVPGPGILTPSRPGGRADSESEYISSGASGAPDDRRCAHCGQAFGRPVRLSETRAAASGPQAPGRCRGRPTWAATPESDGAEAAGRSLGSRERHDDKVANIRFSGPPQDDRRVGPAR